MKPLGKLESPDWEESEIDASFWDWANNNPAQYASPEEIWDMELANYDAWLVRNFPEYY